MSLAFLRAYWNTLDGSSQAYVQFADCHEQFDESAESWKISRYLRGEIKDEKQRMSNTNGNTTARQMFGLESKKKRNKTKLEKKLVWILTVFIWKTIRKFTFTLTKFSCNDMALVKRTIEVFLDLV